MKRYKTPELAAMIKGCHERRDYDLYFEEMCREYNTRTDEPETRPAGKNDNWSAYTDIECNGESYEIRHPKAPFSNFYTTWHWSDEYGFKLFGLGHIKLETAIATIRAN